jgi:hypothetical protein
MTDNKSHSSRYAFTKGRGKTIFVAVSVIFITLLLDTSIIRVSDLTLKSTSSWTLVLFAIIVAISLVGQNLILRFIKQKVNESTSVQKSLRLSSIYKLAVTVHYILAAILVFVLSQMLMTSRYNVVLLTAAITISYVFAVAMMVILCHRFFSWFRVNKNYVVLLYSLSSLTLAINTCVTLWLVNSILLTLPGEVMPRVMMIVPSAIDVNPISRTLNYAYIITTIISFIITWCATIGLLKNYTHRLGKFTYWLILVIPLAYFVSQFLVLSLGLFGPLLISNPIFFGLLFTLIFTLSKPIGGIIFGVGFWLIAKNIQKDNVVRSYLIISAYGFLLLFTSNQAMVLTSTQYPPFGLVTISFVGLSSYLVLVGIYSSAISISQDANLRREIRHLAVKESRMLHSIGLAQVEEEVKRRVLHIARINKNHLAEAALPSALDDEDVNRYLDAVLKEIKTSKKERPFSNENP